MKQIALSNYGKHKGKYFAQVDDDDYDFLIRWRWMVQLTNSSRIYAYRKGTIADGIDRYKGIAMHRVVMGIKKDDKRQVDHIDHNCLNNQKHNLRLCTKIQNQQNRIKTPNKTSKYIGVSFNKNIKAWHAQITVNKKRMFLGYFTDEIEAAKVRDEAAVKYFGEFAKLNITL